ncbi:MAG TPA: hypothetical protein VFG01_02690 [Acidobacteriota bacterium]|nr:hypothetical protein [Acidobacteriota bacterium]
MKASKWISLLSLSIFLIGLTACGGGGKYSDLLPLVKKFNQETEKFVSEMDKADSAKKVASALTNYNKAMSALRPKMEKIQEKYPELNNMSSPPPELGQEGKKMSEMMMKMGSVMMKTMQYADDPEVKKAMDEFDKSMK